MSEPQNKVGDLRQVADMGGREYWFLGEDQGRYFRVVRTLPRFSQTLCRKCREFGGDKSPVYIVERSLRPWPNICYQMVNEHRSLGCASVELNHLFRKHQIERLNRSLRQ